MRLSTLGLALASTILGALPGRADEIRFPTGLERGREATVIYRLDKPATGRGVLDIRWRDDDGRLVERRRLALTLDRTQVVRFRLDLRRAVATGNELRIRFSFRGRGPDGRADRRDSVIRRSFLVPPSAAGAWADYRIIMWQPQSAAQDAALKTIGVRGAMLLDGRGSEDRSAAARAMAPLLQSDLRPYVENIATDFYSAYHRWSPGRPPNWRFLAAKQRYRDNPTDPTAFFRDPSLSDPVWLARIRARLAGSVAVHRRYRPLFYDLGDETGIGDVAAFWDFDLSPPSLDGMRAWLKRQYPSLAALNAEWGTRFAAWGAVVPMTTATALRQTDGNYAAWADFKAWMDVAFARALRQGTAAVHAADPHALAAIEGAQIPGWGGYDYTRLATAVDVMEIYDAADNVEIARSLNPKLVLLTTSFGAGPAEAHRVWRELLRGSRGSILWDEDAGFARQDGSLGPRGRDAVAYFPAIADGLGALFISSRRRIDPIAILYSPASQRTLWLLDQQPKGDAWVERSAETEDADNAIRASTRRFVALIEHGGRQPRFVSPQEIAQGELRRAGIRILVLPQALALSPMVAQAIRRFTAQGGTVIADGAPGRFDAHSRRLPQPQLTDLFAGGGFTGGGRAVGQGRTLELTPRSQTDAAAAAVLARVFSARRLRPAIALQGPGGTAPSDIETYVFRNGGIELLGLLRESPPGAGTEPLVVTLPRRQFVSDLRSGQAYDRVERVSLAVGATAPALLAVSDAPLVAPALAGPRRARLGEVVRFRLSGTAAAKVDVLHIAVIAPSGRVLQRYSGNALAQGGAATAFLPLALNDPTGRWTIRVTDVLSGQTAALPLDVAAP